MKNSRKLAIVFGAVFMLAFAGCGDEKAVVEITPTPVPTATPTAVPPTGDTGAHGNTGAQSDRCEDFTVKVYLSDKQSRNRSERNPSQSIRYRRVGK